MLAYKNVMPICSSRHSRAYFEWRRKQIGITFLYANMLESTQC